MVSEQGSVHGSVEGSGQGSVHGEHRCVWCRWCVCLHACMHAFVCVHAYPCICACMHACVHVYVCMHACVYMPCMHVFMHACILCMCACVLTVFRQDGQNLDFDLLWTHFGIIKNKVLTNVQTNGGLSGDALFKNISYSALVVPTLTVRNRLFHT